ncbi:MAG: flavodoxin family protein [Bacilli bacterium]|nr:flavodoxin family protein [Bacilli bacterium]
MKIAIVVYSHTGNTLSVAEKLKERLIAAEHSVKVLKVSATEGLQEDLSGYDLFIFGSPVQAFTLPLDMKKCLSGIKSLVGHKAACFVTQQLSPWFGGNRAVRQMTKLCTEKGAEVYKSGIVRWLKNAQMREEQIEKLIDSLCAFD